MNLLIVDDNQYACALAAAQLKKIGIGTTKCVSSGAEALLCLQTERFDALLMDWYMPDVSGAGLLSMLRDSRFKGQSDIPVVVVTAYANNGNIQRALSLGADEVVIKPANSTDLGKAIAKALVGNRKSQTVPANDEIGITENESNELALL